MIMNKLSPILGKKNILRQHKLHVRHNGTTKEDFILFYWRFQQTFQSNMDFLLSLNLNIIPWFIFILTLESKSRRHKNIFGSFIVV